MADQTSIQLQKRPEGVSCNACRRVKMKCVSSNSASPTCDRCERSGKQCMYETHRRGMWRRNHAGKREDPQTSTNNNPAEPLTRGHDGLLRSSGGLDIKSLSSGSYSAPSGSDQSSFPPGTLATALHDETTFGTESSSRFDLSMQNFDIATDPIKIHDPIEMGLISRPSAQILFEGFFEHFNSLVELLDPKLYSFTYTRSRSSLLFTMLLSIASSIFQPQSNKAIKAHSEALLGRALLTCHSTIENVWAIICMYYWKDANDKRGETLIGFASRMASYAEWNTTHRDTAGGGQPLDLGEIKLRQERDRQRVLAILHYNEMRLTYLTKHTPLTSLIVPKTVSRTWIYQTESSYRLGDCTSVSNLEMTNIAHDVYESITKSGEHLGSHQNVIADLEHSHNAMASFNIKIDKWRDEWCTIYSNFPSLQPLQQPITLLQRDYTCLYFNTLYLHMLLGSENRSFHGDQITHTTCICFSSAFSILQRAVHFGEINVIYYLWDNAHRMIAYAAMLVPKLLALGINEPTMLKHETTLILDQATTAYLIASRSMGIRESDIPAHKTGDKNRVSTQARLFSAILTIINDTTSYVEESSEDRGLPDIHFNPDLPWLEEDQVPFNFFAEDRMNHLQFQNIGFDDHEIDQPDYLSSCASQRYERLDLLEDKEFLDSMYVDAGLLPLHESGILFRCS
ncbi:hypothetical protein FPOAC1_005397 [Fusarium poae]|uniref:hypothetical protein n=1 Tax=Fusarium poae TaxID=36050 RepID=UPI001CEBB1DE|nr:hypothetical protein FPOAC1_005397 [Fusarium poae]KAG8672136.1 hypothetical protein FPOAC1_005397 [Fusarium poae]